MLAKAEVFCTNMHFSDNVCSNDGAGLCIESEKGGVQATVVASRFELNYANKDGGGLAVKLQGNITIFQTIFYRNTASSGGGLSSKDRCETVVIQSEFGRNQAFGMPQTDIEEDAACSLQDGGGSILSESSGGFTMFNSVIEHTRSSHGAGGGILHVSGSLFISNCRLDDGSAKIGGMIAVNSNAHLSLSHSSITESAAVLHGGGIYMSPFASYTLDYVTVSRCGVDSGHGGALYMDTVRRRNPSGTLTNCFITRCQALVFGGALYVRDASALHMSNVTVSDSIAYRGGGGGLYATRNLTMGLLAKINFSNNTAPYGKQYATPPVSVAVLNSGVYATQLQVSGPQHLILPPLKAHLLDSFNQSVTMENLQHASVQCIVSDRLSAAFSRVVINGTADFSDFSVTTRNRSVALWLVATGQDLLVNVSINLTFADCPPGTFQTQQGECTFCTEGKYSVLDATAGSCYDCPFQGASCSNHSVSVLNDHWYHSAAMSNLHEGRVSPVRCLPSFCGGGQPPNPPVCRQGRLASSPLCGACPDGHIQYPEHANCVHCQEADAGNITLLLLSSWVYLLIVYLLDSNSRQAELKILFFFLSSARVILGPSYNWTGWLRLSEGNLFSSVWHPCLFPMSIEASSAFYMLLVLLPLVQLAFTALVVGLMTKAGLIAKDRFDPNRFWRIGGLVIMFRSSLVPF